MTPTINSDLYGELLCQYQPKIIKTEAENERFLAIVEELMARSQLTLEEEALLELLVKLIEEFEENHYAMNTSTPQSRLTHLSDAKNLEINDLASILDSVEAATAIIEGRVKIDREQAEALGQFFHVTPELLLSE